MHEVKIQFTGLDGLCFHLFVVGCDMNVAQVMVCSEGSFQHDSMSCLGLVSCDCSSKSESFSLTLSLIKCSLFNVMNLSHGWTWLLLRLDCNLFGDRLVSEIQIHHAVCGVSDLKLNCGMSYQQERHLVLSQSDWSVGNMSPESKIRSCEALKGKYSPSKLLCSHLCQLGRYRKATEKATCCSMLGAAFSVFHAWICCWYSRISSWGPLHHPHLSYPW